ncbi:MAG TPA: DinB family protein, partial [Longimicrobiaceae bacterium]|nr:DinB family protein [Longimicrobiaceae bacterium]
MTETVEQWRRIVAGSLDWKEAHAGFDRAVDGLPPELRGRRPDGYPHSVWELVEHIRLAQVDLLDFMVDPSYTAPTWPDDYWPPTPAPPSEAAWEASLTAIRTARARLKQLAMRPGLDLTAKVPNGDGQTYLRTILVAVDHAAYHTGQIVDV